jgi:hypothetical protein
MGARHRTGAGQPYVRIRRCPSVVKLQHEQDEPLRQLSEMPDDRTVSIVGDPEEGARATHRYHRGDCFVLDQVGNRGRTRKVVLADLPEGYAPRQLCAPGSRSSTGASGGPAGGSRGVQPGHLVYVEDVDTGRVSTYRITSSDRPRDSGEISLRSPLGVALVGQVAGEVFEFTPPKGGSRKLRILRFEAGSD